MSAAVATASRRACLSGAAVFGAAIGGASSCQPASAADGADAGLIALCAEWRRAFDREKAVTDRLACKLEKDWSDEEGALWDEVQDAVAELEHRVFATKATTLAGIKANVLDYLDAAAGIPAPSEHAASLVADVLALGGAA